MSSRFQQLFLDLGSLSTLFFRGPSEYGLMIEKPAKSMVASESRVDHVYSRIFETCSAQDAEAGKTTDIILIGFELQLVEVGGVSVCQVDGELDVAQIGHTCTYRRTHTDPVIDVIGVSNDCVNLEVLHLEFHRGSLVGGKESFVGRVRYSEESCQGSRTIEHEFMLLV